MVLFINLKHGKMKKLLFVMMTVAFVFVGLTINANTSSYSILQYCMEGNTQTPLAGVDVKATHSMTRESSHGTSDLSGWAVIGVRSSGTYNMEASYGSTTISGSPVNVNSSTVTSSSSFVF